MYGICEENEDKYQMNENDRDGVEPFDGRFKFNQAENCVFCRLLVDRLLDIQRLLRYLLHIIVAVFKHIALCDIILEITVKFTFVCDFRMR